LRRAIAARSTSEGFPATADTTVVTNGGAEAIYIALQAVLSAESTALVVEPVSPHVIEMITFIGAKIERISPSVGDRFVPSSSAIEQSRANALVISSPSLISGVEIPASDLERLIGAAVAQGMDVILDRSGVPCLYQPQGAPFNAELGANVITIGSFSAGYGLHGWRVGFFTAPGDRAAKLRGLKQAMSICTTAVSQFAALAALEGPTEWLAARREEFNARRAAVVEQLRSSSFSVVSPDAYPALLIDARSVHSNDRELTARLAREYGIAVEPGSRFGDSTQGFLRIDLGVESPVLRSGIERIAQVRAGGADE
jgi:aspartate/methionine/tyrosine aminotransferase